MAPPWPRQSYHVDGKAVSLPYSIGAKYGPSTATSPKKAVVALSSSASPIQPTMAYPQVVNQPPVVVVPGNSPQFQQGFPARASGLPAGPPEQWPLTAPWHIGLVHTPDAVWMPTVEEVALWYRHFC